MISKRLLAFALLTIISVALRSASVVAADAVSGAFRPPAVPLVTSDPFLSIWSEADRLTDDLPRHWTHRPHSLASMIRVDGKSSRLMGSEPKAAPAMPQVGLKVLPTRSIYDFEDSRVHVTLTFMTPALPDDLDVLTRPVTYLDWKVRSIDGSPHVVSIFDSTSSELAVNVPTQLVEWKKEAMGSLTAMRFGNVDQPILASMGDDIRIDWGYAYAVASTAYSKSAIGETKTLAESFVLRGTLPAEDDARMPRAVKDGNPAMAFVFDLGSVAVGPVERRVMIGYDEIYAIKFFGQKLRPYWRRNGATPSDLFQQADREYAALVGRCEDFDHELMADLTKVGGSRYAQIAALAYRQCLAGTGIAADSKKQPLLFTKENTSNGDIATVDVIFPMEPIFLALSPTLAKASLVGVLNYSASDHWKFPCSPHDLGTYPIARGTDDGGEAMPVEESGNMILLCDAIARADGNADFVTPWWPQLTKWAGFLEKYGLDPEDQLCTDDFMGHLAHNANLSVKAILALAAYGDLCRMRGESQEAERYTKLAKADAKHWVRVAAEGDHYRLAFDQPKTWSQKYNLVWDRILGLDVFPPEVAEKEVTHYKRVIQPFGVPLDSRTRLTKTDWSLWSATLASRQVDFEAIVSPIYDYLNVTTARCPLVDSYVTDDLHSDGMHARPVVGGIFVKMLAEPELWKKWAGKDHDKPGPWAALPVMPQVTDVIASSRHSPATWRYTIKKPANDWTEPGFDDSDWKEGPGGFGNPGTPGAVVGTKWTSDDIWIRRTATMPKETYDNLQALVYHDEDIELYIDGILATREGGYVNSYQTLDIRPSARALLKPGATVTLAAHCHQTEGGQGIDVGIVNVKEQNP